MMPVDTLLGRLGWGCPHGGHKVGLMSLQDGYPPAGILAGLGGCREVLALCQQACLSRYLHPAQEHHQEVWGRPYPGIRCSDSLAWRHPPLPRG